MSFTSDAKIVIKELNDYYYDSINSEKPVIHQISLEKLINDLNLKEYVKSGELSDRKLSEFLKKYLSLTTRLHNPAYLAHQVAVPHYSGALAAMVDSFTNNAMAIYEMGPAAAGIEFFVVNWMLEKIGWEPSPLKILKDNRKNFGAGVFTHGGSLANLTALNAARKKTFPQIDEKGNPENLALLASSECHYSIEKAAVIMGIGKDAIYSIDVDDRGSIIPEKLMSTYKMLQDDGKRAFALVANACNTSVGTYDPINEIGDFCKEKKIWFHVDGAHGASALLSKKYKPLLNGIVKADSLTWDAHKMMKTPTLCAALLMKDYRNIDIAFKQDASYIFYEKEQLGIDLINRTVECTKSGLGLKFFMVLAALGEKGLSQYVEKQFDLTSRVYDYIDSLSNFECAVKPESNILCFRVKGVDKLQLIVRNELNRKGVFYISTTMFQGRRYLRLSIMNSDTTLEIIKQLIKQIEEILLEMNVSY